MISGEQFYQGDRQSRLFDWLGKCELDDLISLAHVLDVYVSYDDDPEYYKRSIISGLIQRLGELHLASDQAARLNEGLRLLGIK